MENKSLENKNFTGHNLGQMKTINLIKNRSICLEMPCCPELKNCQSSQENTSNGVLILVKLQAETCHDTKKVSIKGTFLQILKNGLEQLFDRIFLSTYF